MASRIWLALALFVFVCVGCRPKPDTLIDSGYDEAEMDAAIARAQREVETFIQELTKPTGEDHAVKAPIKEGEETEHFWLTDVTFKDGQFEGKISNDPGIVSNVKFGQPWKIAKGEISDWMFMRGGKMHGNYTMRPLLKAMPKDEADALRALLAEP